MLCTIELFGIIYTIFLIFFGIIGVLEFLAAGLVGVKAGSVAVCLIFVPFATYGTFFKNYWVLLITSIILGSIMGALWIHTGKLYGKNEIILQKSNKKK